MIPKDKKAGTGYIELDRSGKSLIRYAYCPVHSQRSSRFRQAIQPDFDGKLHWLFRCGDKDFGHLFPATQPSGAPKTKEEIDKWVERLMQAKLREMSKPTQ